MRVEIKYVISTSPQGFRQRVVRGLLWLLGFTLGALCSASAQQTNNLQEQVDQLKQQCEQTTQDLPQKIAAIQKQIEDQKSMAAKEKEENEKTRPATISAVGLAEPQVRPGWKREDRDARTFAMKGCLHSGRRSFA